MPTPSVAEFSSVIEAIYDCALDPEKWPEVLPQIAGLMASDSSTFAVHDIVRNDGQRYFDYGIPEAAVRAYFETYAQLNPLMSATPMMKVGIPWTMRMMVPEEELRETRFYKEWLKPIGQADLMGVLALRAGSRIATHAISRREERPLYGDQDIELYSRIAPHICRALTISDALDLKTMTSQALEATLDGLTAAVYLVGRDRSVVYMNAAAERQLAGRHAALAIVDHRLLPADPTAASKLTRALLDAVAEKGALPAGGDSIALAAPGAQGLIATVLPLERGRRQNLTRPFAAVAAVFVQDPRTVPLLPGEAFAKLYGLTPSELRIVLAMAPGLQLQETADMLGLSLATVKSHLARVFQKTGTTRQAELVALLLGASSPVAPSDGKGSGGT